VRPALDAVTELHREGAAQRKISFEVRAEGGLTAAIGGDELQMIVGNLVGNAIKYNRDGGTVSVRCARDGSDLRLEVTDTGLGISRENLPQLFQEFFREKRAETRDIVGHGLGLAIVKRIIDQAGGRVEVKSEPNVGSTFTVWLPSAE
jgi:signal transduction histidine kinase